MNQAVRPKSSRRRLLSCTVPLFACVLAIGAGNLRAQGLETPDRQTALNEHVVYHQPGSDVPVAECHLTTLLGRDGSIPQRSLARQLCVDSNGKHFALYWEFLAGSTGAATYLLIDTDDGSWLRVSKDPQLEERGRSEKYSEWMSRLRDVGPEQQVTQVETDELVFDEIDGEVVKAALVDRWRELSERQPDLSARVEWLMRDGGDAKEGLMKPFRLMLEDFVYGGSPESPRALVSEMTARAIVPTEKIAEPDFDREFGKWVTWPDLPHIED